MRVFRQLSFKAKPKPEKVIRSPDMLIQYVLVRSELASMTVGRVAAQVAHAGNKMVWDSEEVTRSYDQNSTEDATPTMADGHYLQHQQFPSIAVPMESESFFRDWREMQRNIGVWQREANGFGTAIVLDANNESTIRRTIEAALKAGLHANIIIDPEYFVQDGTSGHMVPNVLTCGYIFGRKADCDPFTSGFKLLGKD